MKRWIPGLWALGLLALVGLGVALPAAGGAPLPAAQTPSASSSLYLPYLHRPAPDWLRYLNGFRAQAGLLGLMEEPAWSYGNELHARYMVKNDVLTHSEDPNNPWYTPEGAAAGQSSNLVASTMTQTTYLDAFDLWMAAPFHALGLLDPRLQRTGYGEYREADGGIEMAAGVDVLRGRLPSVPDYVQYPILWPGDGTTVHLTSYVTELPDPLTSCPGYTAPAGLPLLVQVGNGTVTPTVTASSFAQGNTPLEHCVFDETSYVNPDPDLQTLGRLILSTRDAVVLIPRQPLQPGATYTASLTVNGRTYTWSFSVSATARSPGMRAKLGPLPRLRPSGP